MEMKMEMKMEMGLMKAVTSKTRIYQMGREKLVWMMALITRENLRMAFLMVME
jgi:hypothetical protein